MPSWAEAVKLGETAVRFREEIARNKLKKMTIDCVCGHPKENHYHGLGQCLTFDVNNGCCKCRRYKTSKSRLERVRRK